MADDNDSTNHDVAPSGPLATMPVDGSTDRIAGQTTAAASIDRDASFGFGAAATPASSPDLVGDSVGGVRILRVIADGGMGRVYEGVQESPCRRVAVKVLRPDLVSADRLRRFAFEAEILGRLKHPGIAQIHTAGMHSTGGVERPYFVMEYVEDARSITTFVRERSLGIRDRLLLFKEVCDAVGHGHSRGVIHRDLKPANLLVDAAGRPKVIDYGVARATGADVPHATQATTLGDLVGTAAYMSPEQFAANPDDIDVRTDVYSLGIVLHEMLAGRHPFDLRRLPVYEVARIVREANPARLEEACPAAGRDVACIVAKCLEKDPARRYGSAGELAEDIRRHLDGELILAVPPTLFDTVRRFVSRHRAVTAAAAVSGLSIVAALVGMSISAIEASRQAAEARRGRERADAVLAFLVDALQSPDPARDGRNVTVAETLTRAADALRSPDHAGIADPETRGSILSAVGATLRKLGLPREAVGVLEDAVESTGSENAPSAVVASLAGALQAAGEIERSLAMSTDLLARVRVDGSPQTVSQTLRAVASTESQMSRFDDAWKHATESIDVLEAAGLASPRDRAASLTLLGAIAQQQGRYQDAMVHNERALRISEEAFGLRDVETLVILGRLGTSLDKLNQRARATQLYERGIPVAEDFLGDDHPVTATLLESYGMSLIGLGRERDAEEPLRRALESVERRLGPDHISVATIGEKIGWSLLRRGRSADAEPILLRSLQIKEVALGPRNVATAHALAMLGWAVASQNRTLEAQLIIERCLSIRREVLGDDNAETARALFALAENCMSRGHVAEAATHAEESIAIMERLYGPENHELIAPLHSLSRARQAVGDHDAAVSLAQRALAIRERLSPEVNLDTALALRHLGDRLRRGGRVDESRPYYARALSIREKLLEPGSPLIAELRPFVAADQPGDASPQADASAEKRGEPASPQPEKAAR